MYPKHKLNVKNSIEFLSNVQFKFYIKNLLELAFLTNYLIENYHFLQNPHTFYRRWCNIITNSRIIY
jgi:hypothetical protein